VRQSALGLCYSIVRAKKRGEAEVTEADAGQPVPTQQEAAPAASLRKRRSFLLVVAVAVVALAGVGLWLFLGKRQPSKPVTPESRLVSLFKAETTFNLAVPSEYIVLNLDLEVKGDEGIKAVEQGHPKLADALIKVLAGYRLSDLAGEAGKEGLGKRLVERFNEVLEEPVVTRVYFTTFVTQKT